MKIEIFAGVELATKTDRETLIKELELELCNMKRYRMEKINEIYNKRYRR